MIVINGMKGIWTLDQVIKLLQDSKVEFKILVDNHVDFNHKIEVRENENGAKISDVMKIGTFSNGAGETNTQVLEVIM